jgi:hypothetical protein
MALYEIEGAGSLDLSAASSLVSTGTAVAVNCSVTQPYDIGFMVVGAAAGVISAASPNSPASSVFDTGNVAVAGASVLNNFGAFSAEFGHPIDIVSSATGNDTNTFKATLGSSVAFTALTLAFRPAAIQVNASGSNLSVMSPTNSMSDAVPATSLSGFLNPSYDTRGNITTVIAAEGPMLFNGATWDRQRSAQLPGQLAQQTTAAPVGQPGIAVTEVISGPAGTVVQIKSAVSTGSVASLAAPAFAFAPSKSNSIIVVVAVGNGTAPSVADNQAGVYKLAASQLGPSSAFGVYVFYGVFGSNVTGTITATNNGATASMAITAYEVAGLLAIVAQQPDQTATAVGTSGTAASVALNPQYDNEISFSGVALGTAAQTITPAAGWINDSGQLNPITPAGLFSMVSMSQFIPDYESVIPQATFTSEPWAIASASFRPIALGVADQNNTCVDTVTGDAQTFVGAATYPGVTQINRHNRGAMITVEVGAGVSGTLPTLTIQPQWSPNNGVTWLNFGAPLSGTTLLQANTTGSILIYPSLLTGLTFGGAVIVLTAAPLPRTWRLSYTVGGTVNPTFPITVFVNYLQ